VTEVDKIRSWIKYWLRYCFSFIVFAKKTHLWLKVIFSSNKNHSKKAIFYGYHHIPNIDEPISGGIVKFQRLNQYLPNSLSSFNILYLGSSALPADWRQLLWLAKRKRAKFVINQNGVWYPKHGPGWKISNLPMKRLVHEADYVFYQSIFCKKSSDRFLGERKGPYEILYNCVDTIFFSPGKFQNDPKRINILLGGNHGEPYRVETALKTLALVRKKISNIYLYITGNFVWIRDKDKAKHMVYKLAHSLGVDGNVTLLGTYCQADAPKIFRFAHLLLHTQYNDACPGLVVEAMSCGLPVVYSDSGGVPELVGDEAGIGVSAETNWDKEVQPDPNALAKAVFEVIENRKVYSFGARQRAVANFDINPWIRRHQDVFDSLLLK
jgi:glycosyltransferase involved in cell wall biosynthesis